MGTMLRLVKASHQIIFKRANRLDDVSHVVALGKSRS